MLDLSRILAGPTATQLLGDLGADVLKVERPGSGDDTRAWGPPFVDDVEGRERSAYFACANRNKRSIAIDVATPAGAALVRRLAREADVLVENWKAGDLARRGLGYDDVRRDNERIVYCSITGYGQTGPRAAQPGYDLVAQARGGIMSLTGDVDGAPSKVGVGIADVMCGMYAAVAILAALRHRDASGRGQHIDLALLDTQIAWLINEGTNYLVSGRAPSRRGNGHPNIVPYQVFASADGHVVIACGNDAQYARFVELAGRPELAHDARFATNAARVAHRAELLAILEPIVASRASAEWESALTRAGVPAGAVLDVPAALAEPQVVHREMRVRMDDASARAGVIELLGNPIKLSETPVTYRRAPPRVGEHAAEALSDWLGLAPADLDALVTEGALPR